MPYITYNGETIIEVKPPNTKDDILEKILFYIKLYKN